MRSGGKNYGSAHKGRSREHRDKKKQRSDAREAKMLSRERLYAEGRMLAQKTTVHYEPQYLSNEPKAEAYPQPNELFSLLAQKDYDDMMKSNTVAVTPRVKQLMLMQSIVGHAQSGHSRFRNIAFYPNATIDDVYDALGKNSGTIRRQRQEIIDGITWYIERALKDPYDKRLKHLWNQNGAPLAGALMLQGYELRPQKGDVLAVLRGMYLASTMDNYVDWRTRVQDRFGIVMGGGCSFAINLLHLTANGESLQSLATEPHDNNFIQMHIALESIIDQESVESGPHLVNGYVRVAKGKGVSDDGALITAGVKYGGIPAFFGAFLIDAVDTWDKSTPQIKRGGQDEALGKLIWEESQAAGIDLSLNERSVEEFIFGAAIDPERPTQYPDCSQRRFLLQSDRKGIRDPYYALRLHREFVEMMLAKKPRSLEQVNFSLPDRLLGFAEVSSDHFYDTWLNRFYTSHENGLVSTPMYTSEQKMSKKRTVLHAPRIREEWD